jgi:hypothetical protein
MGLGVVEFLLAVEDEFGVELPHGARLATRLGELHTCIVTVLDQRGEPVNPLDVWDRLVRVVEQQAEVPAESVGFDTDFRRDLGLSS